MDRNRNIVVELNGRTLGFRVDNWVLRETQRKCGCKGVVELLTRIGLDDGNMDIEAFTILIMEAYNEYQYFNKVEVKIDERSASNLIDEMGGIISSLEIITEALQTYIPKNSQPPQEVGEISQ